VRRRRLCRGRADKDEPASPIVGGCAGPPPVAKSQAPTSETAPAATMIARGRVRDSAQTTKGVSTT
jgi:hypothetical protein